MSLTYTAGYNTLIRPNQNKLTGADEGPFLRNVGPTICPTPIINNTAGTVRMGCSLLFGVPGANGDGILAHIHFECVGVGFSMVRFNQSTLFDSVLESIPHETVDGEVNQIDYSRLYLHSQNP